MVQALFSVLKASSSDEMQQTMFGLIQLLAAKIEDLTYRLDVSEKQSQHALEEVTRLTGAGCKAMPQEAATNKAVATRVRVLGEQGASQGGPRQGSVGSIALEEPADSSLQSSTRRCSKSSINTEEEVMPRLVLPEAVHPAPESPVEAESREERMKTNEGRVAVQEEKAAAKKLAGALEAEAKRKQARKAKDEAEKAALEKYRRITESVDTKVRRPQSPMERRRERQIEKAAKQAKEGTTGVDLIGGGGSRGMV